jgi:hypothetical protein
MCVGGKYLSGFDLVSNIYDEKTCVQNEVGLNFDEDCLLPSASDDCTGASVKVAGCQPAKLPNDALVRKKAPWNSTISTVVDVRIRRTEDQSSGW